MLTIEYLMTVEKADLEKLSKVIDKEDLSFLIDLLNEKDNNIRYQALLLLQHRSALNNDIYPFWDIFLNKLKSKNSYQRSIGLMLIAENTKWDIENKLETTIDQYLMLIDDEKPITVRQCIQCLAKIIPSKKYLMKIANKLMSVDISCLRTSMKKLILLDILEILILIKKVQTSDEIENYIFNKLSGEILDKKAKQQLKAAMN